jgi:hypothetical protein
MEVPDTAVNSRELDGLDDEKKATMDLGEDHTSSFATYVIPRSTKRATVALSDVDK